MAGFEGGAAHDVHGEQQDDVGVVKQRHSVLVVSAPLVGGLPPPRYGSRHLPDGYTLLGWSPLAPARLKRPPLEPVRVFWSTPALDSPQMSGARQPRHAPQSPCS
ncbi:MAG: hypothetical protein ACK56F_23250, partial [bacterium]